MKIKLTACVFIAIALSGCETMPRVQYGEASKDEDGLIKFQLAGSVILVKQEEKRNPDGAVYQTVLGISSVPIEEKDGAPVYSMRPVSDIESSTKVKNVTYLPNTRLIKSIGTEVTDNRVKVLQTVVAAAGVVKGVAFQAEPRPAEFPPDTVLDIRPALAAGEPSYTKDLSDGWKATVTFSNLSEDAVLRKKMLGSEVLTQQRGVYVYSSCRRANVSIEKGKNVYTASVVVNDPSHLHTQGFPAKGVISHHASCGVDVVDERSATGIPDGLDKLFDSTKTLLEKKAAK